MLLVCCFCKLTHPNRKSRALFFPKSECSLKYCFVVCDSEKISVLHEWVEGFFIETTYYTDLFVRIAEFGYYIIEEVTESKIINGIFPFKLFFRPKFLIPYFLSNNKVKINWYTLYVEKKIDNFILFI